MRGLIPESVPSMTAGWNFFRTIRERALPPPATILDIGANGSQMALLLKMAATANAGVLSFEPNLAVHPMGEVFRLALSDVDGSAELILPQGDSLWGTISTAHEDSKRIGTGQTVRCARMDTLVDNGEVRFETLQHPILVKIDTEGGEKRVIDGFGDVLKQVDMLLVEVDNKVAQGHEYDIVSISSFLSSRGFIHGKVLYACYDGPSAPSYLDVLFWK